MNIFDKIKKRFEERSEWTVKELTDQLLVSKQSVHAALNKLIDTGWVQKFGRTPKTFYKKINQQLVNESPTYYLTDDAESFLGQHFLMITELGEMLEGMAGFAIWCQKRSLPIEKTVREFVSTKQKYLKHFDELQMIDGTGKLKNTTSFENIHLDEIKYLDFYAIERFGKTKLGTLLHYAKQGQNKFLMNILIQEIKPKIDRFLKAEKFDAVCFVPPTIRREVQIMKFIETFLKINLPKVKIQKISGIIPVPQKSLNKIEERINNADHTFSLTKTVSYKKVLLIDDAVGSGATMNQIAKKLKEKEIAINVTGLAIVGSFKGFDVITDI